MEVYVNEILLNLPESEGIEIVKQINGLADLKSRQADRTSRIAAPKTLHNRQALGMPDQIGGAEDAMYQSNDGRVHVGGFPIIQSGTARVIGVDDDISIVISSGLKSFTKLIDGLTLHDIDWSDLDHVLSVANVIASFSNTTGYIYPVVQYGSLTTASLNFDIRFSHPGIYFKTILERIFTAQGWTVSGDVLTDGLFEATVLPFSKNRWEHSERFLELTGFAYSLAAQQTISGVGYATATNEFEGQVTLTPSASWTSPVGQTLTSVTANISVSNFSKTELAGNSMILKVAIRQNGTVIATTSVTGLGNFSVSSSSVVVSASDVLDVAIVADHTVADSTNPATFSMKLISCNFFTEAQDKTIAVGDTIMAESYLPKMNQLDFIMAVMHMWGIVPDVDPVAKTINLRYFNEIIDNKANADDWTTKLVRKPNWEPGRWYDKKEKVGKYFQSNELRYKEDELNPDPDLGRGVISINDTSLPDRDTLITLPFAASEGVYMFNHSTLVASIPFWDLEDTAYEQQYNPKQRVIFIVREDEQVDVTDGTTTTSNSADTPFGRFIDPSQPQSLGFDATLISNNYNGFAASIDRGVRLSVLLNISPSEFMNLDHFTPKYFQQLNGHYYIEQAKWNDGDFVKADMVRV